MFSIYKQRQKQQQHQQQQHQNADEDYNDNHDDINNNSTVATISSSNNSLLAKEAEEEGKQRSRGNSSEENNIHRRNSHDDPIVIVPLGSHSSSESNSNNNNNNNNNNHYHHHHHHHDNNSNTSSSTATTASPSSFSSFNNNNNNIHSNNATPTAATAGIGWSPATSPLAMSLVAKKKRAMCILLVPFVFAVAFRTLHSKNLYLPNPDVTTTKTKNKIFDVNSPPIELPEGETIAHLMETTTTTAPTTETAAIPETAYPQQQSQTQHYSSSSSASSSSSSSIHTNSFFPSAPSASFSRSASLRAEEKQQYPRAEEKQQYPETIPVIVDRGEKIPAGVGAKKLSAAEALMCRESVVNYVINATNGKDECTGLQKAFDETCSQEDEEEVEEEVRIDEDTVQAETVDPKIQDQNDIWLGQEGNNNGQRKLLSGKRRRLQLTQQKRAKEMRDFDWLQVFTFEASRYLLAIWELLPFVEKRPIFHAEDAVFRLYPNMKRRQLSKRHPPKYHHHHYHHEPRRYNISDLAKNNHYPFAHSRRQQEESTALGEESLLLLNNGATIDNQADATTDAEFVDDDDDDDEVMADKNITTSEDDEKQQQAANKIKPAKPHNSLHLPTGQAHLSGKALEKTLLLQQEEKVMSDLKKKTANSTNATKAATHDPKEEAHASAKAVADTSELVSAVLNDPTAIEARACCTSILNVYHENCNMDAEEEISDKRLFIVVLIMAFCGMVKSLIRHFKIRWLPEAAGCILVGVASGYSASFFPHQDFSFDGNWFLRILVPPIVFEAALSIDKKAFNRHVVPIIIYSTVGTLFATVLTASIVYNATHWLGRFCETIPYVESLIFGSLISSIDPIAVLSVLSNMGMTDTDTLYVLVFGESLLNDGVAIVLFQTLVRFLDASVIIDSEAIMAAVIHFVVVALGSVLIGVGSGIMCTLYYWAFHGCQTPLVECLMFLCWALLPYYVCDGIGWSGIVSAVTVGFVMDMYVIGAGDSTDDESDHSHRGGSHSSGSFHEDEIIVVERPTKPRRQIFSGEGHLSVEARVHIGFVTEIVATMMETAIFAYLGLFLFSHRYHWNVWHVFVSIFACCLSRAIMIPTLSALANWITSMQKYQNRCRGINKSRNSPATGVIVDRKMQMVLWFAGLRGAMSFALVEHIPLFDAVTGEGTRMKAELKAMTSASIMFTVFVLGGSTNYFMDYVGLSPSAKSGKNELTDMELVPLTAKGQNKLNGTSNRDHGGRAPDTAAKSGQTRQRVRQKEDLER